MSIRNIKLKPLRTIMASIGIAGCVALLLSGFGVGDTLSKSLKNDLGNNFNYNVVSTYRGEEFKQKLTGDSRIDIVEDYSRVYTEIDFNGKKENIYVYQIAQNSQLSKIQLEGEQVAVSSSIASDLNLSVGDEIVINFRKLIVSKIVDSFFGKYLLEKYAVVW